MWDLNKIPDYCIFVPFINITSKVFPFTHVCNFFISREIHSSRFPQLLVTLDYSAGNKTSGIYFFPESIFLKVPIALSVQF